MALPFYGVLKGTIIDKLDSIEAVKKNPSGKPHYQLKVQTGNQTWRVAINVKSDQDPPNLQVYRDEHYAHPILTQFESFAIGYTHLASQAGTGALDFIKENLFDLSKMVVLPATGGPSGNDLNDIFNVYISHAMSTPGALVYAFGSEWNDNKPDPYFNLTSGHGIHDIHFNQGNEGSHAKDNGEYQDGAFFIYYPDEKKWLAVFMKFQSQIIHVSSSTVSISAALINPKGSDVGKEQVYLMNTGTKAIDLTGWSIADSGKHKDVLGHITLNAGDVYRYTLTGHGAALSNNGGTITLSDKDGHKVDGVSYTAKDAHTEGVVFRFK